MFGASSDTVLLAALGVLYLIDNASRLPLGAYRFAIAPGAGWSVRRIPGEGERPRNVEFPLPILHWGFTVPTTEAGSLSVDDCWTRWRMLRPHERRLSVLSSASMTFLFIGYPVAEAFFTALGAAIALALSAAASITVATLAYRTLRRIGCDRREAFRLSRGLAWPIQAPAAPGRVMQRAMAEFHPLAVARTLLPDASFYPLTRPLAYDDHYLSTDGDRPTLGKAVWDRLLYPHTFPTTLSAPPTPTAGPAYCPRCGREYRSHEGACAECAVALVRVG